MAVSLFPEIVLDGKDDGIQFRLVVVQIALASELRVVLFVQLDILDLEGSGNGRGWSAADNDAGHGFFNRFLDAKEESVVPSSAAIRDEHLRLLTRHKGFRCRVSHFSATSVFAR